MLGLLCRCTVTILLRSLSLRLISVGLFQAAVLLPVWWHARDPHCLETNPLGAGEGGWGRHCSSLAWSEAWQSFLLLDPYVDNVRGSYCLPSMRRTLSCLSLVCNTRWAGLFSSCRTLASTMCVCVHACFHIVLQVLGVSRLLFAHLEHMLAYFSLFVKMARYDNL